MVRIRNIYYLLCYAWDDVDISSSLDVSGAPSDRVEHLLAHVLVAKTNELLRRGLYREYISHDDDLRGPRGKIDVTGYVTRSLRGTGRIACRVDELSHDVALNQ